MELDADIGKVMDEIRKDAPNTIVIVTADNGAWLDAYPDAGTTPFRGEKGSPFEGGWRVPGIMWWPGHIPARAKYDEMMSHIDAWATLAAMVGLDPPPHEWVGNDGKPIYFDSIDNSAYILGKAEHSARKSWIYIDGETFNGARADIGGDPKEPWVNIAWKYLYTAKDSWLGSEANLGAIGATYNLTMDPYEKYDMTFNGAAPTRVLSTSPGKYSGQDNGWVLALIGQVMIDFDKSVMKFPNIKRFVGGASNDLVPNLQHPGRSGAAVEAADREDGRAARRRRRRLIAPERKNGGGFGRRFDSVSLEVPTMNKRSRARRRELRCIAVFLARLIFGRSPSRVLCHGPRRGGGPLPRRRCGRAA